MLRKPHPASVLKNLPDEDQAALFEFLRGKSLADGVAWLFGNNGIRTNDSSLGDWRGWYELRQRIYGYNADAEELKRLLGTDTDIDPNLVPKLNEALFLSRAAELGDAKTFAVMAGIMQRDAEMKNQQKAHADKMRLETDKLTRKDRTLDQAERKIVQQERKIAALEKQADAAKRMAERTKEALNSGGMDDATRASLVAEIDHLLLGKPKPNPKKA
jgi:hypothetical protein